MTGTALLDLLGLLAVVAGALVMTLGTAGLIRLPDAASRLHALAKLDNAGLGLLAIGLVLMADDFATVLLVLATWVTVVVTGTSAAQLLAAEERGEERSDG